MQDAEINIVPNHTVCWRGAELFCCFFENATEECDTANCFPSTAKVNLENGKSVRMSELQVGDKVQTGM